ncbi:uracil-DNA glycosylase family protein [Paenibacillus cymbidii]|uniref:uracil-DNA glycosylase family protein n=1 Tax=Paenibacillus cymbidii TaxID=1639034 RepID=UPI001436B2E3|nr:uracil-DNA glycosylase family protein [Paenibacillus cymbidii]
MGHFRTTINGNGESFDTLADILPESGSLNILIVAKVPAPTSVAIGHYFQGHQGQMFWSGLTKAGLLSTLPDEFEDEALMRHRIGLMDIVKKPKEYGIEPTKEDYRQGVDRIMRAVFTYQPEMLIFVYKKVLDQILKHGFREQIKTRYGLNEHLDLLFRSKVFVYPMPGVGRLNKEAIDRAMDELVRECLQR